MTTTLKQFRTLLFNDNEFICTGSAKAWQVVPVEKLHPVHEFICINPLNPTGDAVPMAEWHRADLPRRADHNVTAFRNILVEIDDMPLDQQAPYILKIELPYSTQVYSGGKSMHFILSLEESLPDKAAYDQLVTRVYKAVKKMDRKARNCSRLSRSPEHFREDTQATQTLLYTADKRLPNAHLESWLQMRGIKQLEAQQATQRPAGSPIRMVGTLSPASRNFLMMGAPDGCWNDQLFRSACDAARNGYTEDRFLELAGRITGHLDSNDLTTVKSAYRSVAAAPA